MRINPYLSFRGQCREAFTFYARTFGGSIDMIMTQGESPIADQLPPDSRNAVMHAQMHVGDQVLMGADAPRGGYTRPSGGCVIRTRTSPSSSRIRPGWQRNCRRR